MTTEQTNIVSLLRELRDETTTLVREEVALAKTEITEKVSVYSRNLTFLAIGALIALLALLLILLSISSLLRGVFVSQGIDDGMAGFLGLMIVGVIAGVVSAALILKGIEMMRRESLTPERTIETLKEDKAWAQRRFA